MSDNYKNDGKNTIYVVAAIDIARIQLRSATNEQSLKNT